MHIKKQAKQQINIIQYIFFYIFLYNSLQKIFRCNPICNYYIFHK